MENTPSRHYAVVMGDLVSSEDNASREAFHRLFNEAVDRQNRVHRDVLASPLTITLGDEFQGLVGSLERAVHVVRDVRLDLLSYGVECRFAIGATRLYTPLNRDRAWNMMVRGLSRTREKLNEKRTSTLYRFALPNEPAIESVLEALGAGLTSIERRWTEQQRRDITESLSGRRPSEIARRRNVSVHSVYKVRGSGDFDLYVVQWQAMIEALTHLDTLYEAA